MFVHRVAQMLYQHFLHASFSVASNSDKPWPLSGEWYIYIAATSTVVNPPNV